MLRSWYFRGQDNKLVPVRAGVTNVPFDIVFVDDEEPEAATVKHRSVGESVFLYDLPKAPKVFVFFYQGSDDTQDVEDRLRALGRRTGDNLFVNLGSLADPAYEDAVERFGIRQLPVVIVTAVAAFAATPDGKTTFVRLDSSALFSKPAELVRTVEELFNLFLAGNVAQAVRSGWIAQGQATAVGVAARIWAIVQPVIAWISRRDLVIDVTSGKIEVKASGSG
jgi:hypothetical protein